MQLASTSPEIGAGKTGAVVGFLAIFAIYKLAVMGLGHPLAWIAGYAIDVAIVGVLWVGAMSLQRAALPGARIASGVVFWAMMALWFAADFAYTYFFPEGLDRHYSLLDVDVGDVRFFVMQLLPWTGWLMLGALLVVWGLTAKWISRVIHVASLKRAGGVVAFVTLIACTLAWRVPDVPNPAVDIARDVRGRLSEEVVSVDPNIAPAASISLFDRSATLPLAHTSRFTRIIVIVMETMAMDTYRKELAALPPNNFFHTLEGHAHAFTRYYTDNQDSRTAMLDMLSSRLTPYEAYSEAGVAVYQGMSRLSNLPAMLHAQGYETAYVLSQVDSEAVVSELPWQKIVTLTQAQIDTLKPRWLCYYPYEFENSCEDKVVLGDVVQFLSKHEKAFVFQEMMWGHALEYNRASGKGNVQYVAEYVDSLWSELKKRRMADSTLLVLTGDHGDKAEDRYDSATNYQVPLFFYSPSFRPEVDDRMRSHLDFKDLLLRELDPTRPAPSPTPFVHVVGPTDTHLQFVVDSSGGFLEYKTRDDKAYVISQTTLHAPNAKAHLAMFQAYQRWFAGMVPKS